MKTLLSIIALIAFTLTVNAVTATLAWDKSPDPTVVGYHLYEGVATRTYTNMLTVTPAATTNVTVANLTVGQTYFFAVTAYTATGLESKYSNEVIYNAPAPVPVITTQPVGGTNQTGSSFTFSVGATGLNLTYQWHVNGSSIIGATNSTLTLNSVTYINNGSYNVTVSNSSGSVTSTSAVFAVIPLAPTGLTVGP